MNYMSLGFDGTSHRAQEDIEASCFLTQNYHLYTSERVETIRLAAENQQQLLDTIGAAFKHVTQDQDSNPVVIGAIPFDTTQPSMLHFYRQHQKQNTASFTQFEHQQQFGSFKLNSQKRLVSKQQFANAIDQALIQFDHNNLEKIVLSQAVDFELSHQQSPYDLVHTLAAQNQHAFSFVIPVEDNAHLLGASPELLISKQGHIVKSNPLAGSRPLSEDDRINQKNIEDLYASTKDLHEHQIVVDSVFKNLKPFCQKLSVSEQPEILKTTTMLHLSSVFEGQLKNEQTNALALALSLHPTPAICGSPTQLSKHFILEYEGYDRNYFAGLVGWMDADGNGEWAVTIRCGLLSERNLRLYAGAGIVKGSEAELEWNETEAKMQTLLKTLNATCET
ncbi:TPA: isochorismate synthase [Acinetobacter baumannii]|uniref:isochorismate synthase n=3 Tax=Acinetobacter baumannii TaxID=470 RepID=A0AAD2U423_ACIBA|nr:isochorismate synthase [Acinetobacter baumannii]ALJ86083.1 Isochorismate synthase of siderophore biosynthesis [Acinetobacter baumannii]ATR85882.1 isochorismate synthase [Acinetobacter baumannii]EGJ62214.1 isochorismate synthase [Acinetobacter baumannii 6013150]EGJ62662.1 isochorismate synthase [Acinetobacter baumannii 6013113]EHU1795534.1 isochorismate synthase [Acinetobacter baumannii]